MTLLWFILLNIFLNWWSKTSLQDSICFSRIVFSETILKKSDSSRQAAGRRCLCHNSSFQNFVNFPGKNLGGGPIIKLLKPALLKSQFYMDIFHANLRNTRKCCWWKYLPLPVFAYVQTLSRTKIGYIFTNFKTFFTKNPHNILSADP